MNKLNKAPFNVVTDYIKTSGHIQIFSIHNGKRSVVYDNTNTIMINAKEVLAYALMQGSDTPASTTSKNSRICKLALSDGAINGASINYDEDTLPSDTLYEVIDYTDFGVGKDWLTDPWKETADDVLAAHDGYSASVDVDIDGKVDKVIFTFAVNTDQANDDVTPGNPLEYNSFGMITADDKLFAGKWVTNEGPPTIFGGIGLSTTIISVANVSGNAVFTVTDAAGMEIGDNLLVTGATETGYNGTHVITNVTGNVITTSSSYIDDSTGTAKVHDVLILRDVVDTTGIVANNNISVTSVPGGIYTGEHNVVSVDHVNGIIRTGTSHTTGDEEHSGTLYVLDTVINIIKDHTRAIEIIWTIQF